MGSIASATFAFFNVRKITVRVSQQIMNITLSRSIFFSLIFALVLYGVNYHISKSLIHLAALLSVINIILAFKNNTMSSVSININTVRMSLIMLIAACISIISTQVFTSPTSGRFLNNFTYPLIFFAVIIVSLKVTKSDYKIIVYASIASCISMGAIGIYDYLQANNPLYRTAGTQNMPIIYASGLALLISWVAAELFNQLKQHQWKLAALCLAAITIGCIGIILTASRGPILAVVLIFSALFIRYLVLNTSKSLSIAVLIISILLLTISTAIFLKTDIGGNLIDRFERGFTSTNNYIVNSNYQFTSANARLDMWKGAILILSDHPLLGIGNGNHQQYFSNLTENKLVNLDKHYFFAHVHNDVLQILMSFGLVLGPIILFFILYPTIVFLRSLKTKTVAITGLAVCCTYILCGLTDAPSFRASSLSIFLLIISFQINMLHSHSSERNHG